MNDTKQSEANTGKFSIESQAHMEVWAQYAFSFYIYFSMGWAWYACKHKYVNVPKAK